MTSIDSASQIEAQLRKVMSTCSLPRGLDHSSQSDKSSRPHRPFSHIPPPPTLAPSSSGFHTVSNPQKHRAADLTEPDSKRKNNSSTSLLLPLSNTDQNSRNNRSSVRTFLSQNSSSPKRNSIISTSTSRLPKRPQRDSSLITPPGSFQVKSSSQSSSQSTCTSRFRKTCARFSSHASLQSSSASHRSSRDSYVNSSSWNPDRKLEEFENMFAQMRSQMVDSTFCQNMMKEMNDLQKQIIKDQHIQIAEFQSEIKNRGQELNKRNEELNAAKTQFARDLSEATQSLRKQIDHLTNQHDLAIGQLSQNHRQEMDQLLKSTNSQIQELTASLESERENFSRQLESLRESHVRELRDMENTTQQRLSEKDCQIASQLKELRNAKEQLSSTLQAECDKLLLEKETLQNELARTTANLQHEQQTVESHQSRINEQKLKIDELNSANCSMKAKIDYLESDSQAQSRVYANMRRDMEDAISRASELEEKLRQEEQIRRQLHNQVQELKGNIRVFCRVRPSLPNIDSEKELAIITYPDANKEAKELCLLGPERESALGNITANLNSFTFDRVFGPDATNSVIFEEISQLVQSALDGYNVCIFCYGQTGSGKTYTMSAPQDGMIPRAVEQIWREKERLLSKGWVYTLTGEIVEVYNEQLHDLLANPDLEEHKKLEIHHDTVRARTTIPDITSVKLESPDTVHELLARAAKNRHVTATKANERSSRSHCVFLVRISGENETTGEHCESVLNLVDLAGSERVKHSRVEGVRLKETQNINRSLSSLGDVIAALGAQSAATSRDSKEVHIPYRNSKLTYLLQFSLGGNSKTLMFVMVNPASEFLSESLMSLKFAKKVHNTHIGSARKQSKVKD